MYSIFNYIGDWKGFIITMLGFILGAVTLNSLVLVCTALAGLSTFALNIYKYYQIKKNKNKE